MYSVIQSLTKFAMKLFFTGSHFSDVNTFISHSARFLFIMALGYLMSLAKYSDKVTALPVDSDMPYNLSL